MRLLVDTHSIIWYVDQDQLLSKTAHDAITDPTNDLLISAGSIWEISIKVGLSKLTLSLPFRRWMTNAIADLDLAVIPITLENAEVQIGLPHHHRDPFDRLLVAQAIVEGLPIVSADAQLDFYGVNRIW